MRVFLRKCVGGLLNERQKKRLKKLELWARKRSQSVYPKLNAATFEDLFRNKMGLREGDVVMVHAGFGSINTKLSPSQVYETLAKVIGPRGTIVVPTFCMGSSARCMSSGDAFDVCKTRSGMGAFSEYVRQLPNAPRSLHPIKSVAAVGAHAQEICFGHEKCEHPFGLGSPFDTMLQLRAKVIGLGVPMTYLSFVHTAEDICPASVELPVWDREKYTKNCFDCDGNLHEVTTYVHNLPLMQKADPGKFCRRYLERHYFKEFKYRGTVFFKVDAAPLVEKLTEGLVSGFTIYD